MDRRTLLKTALGAALTAYSPFALAGNARVLIIGGGWGGLLGNIFSSMPKFAAGGDPPVGRVSLVGERGPELFVPKTAGTIVPNHALGGGEQNVYLTVNVEGGGNAEETGSIVGAKVIQMVRGVVKQELAI